MHARGSDNVATTYPVQLVSKKDKLGSITFAHDVQVVKMDITGQEIKTLINGDSRNCKNRLMNRLLEGLRTN